MLGGPEIIVMLLGVFIGAGFIWEYAGPYLFYYLVLPIISTVSMIIILEQIPIPGLDFEYDKYLRIVFHNQGALLRQLILGFAAGYVLKRGFERIFLERGRRPVRRPLIDPEISMERKKHLLMLGLTNSAGPNDILMAWTRLSAEMRDPNWASRPKIQKAGLTAEEYKTRIDAALAWLNENTKHAKQDRSTGAHRPFWKRFAARVLPKKGHIRDL